MPVHKTSQKQHPHPRAGSHRSLSPGGEGKRSEEERKNEGGDENYFYRNSDGGGGDDGVSSSSDDDDIEHTISPGKPNPTMFTFPCLPLHSAHFVVAFVHTHTNTSMCCSTHLETTHGGDDISNQLRRLSFLERLKLRT